MLILHAKNVRDYYLIYLIFPVFTNLGWPITFHGGEEDWFGCEWKVIIIIFLCSFLMQFQSDSFMISMYIFT